MWFYISIIFIFVYILTGLSETNCDHFSVTDRMGQQRAVQIISHQSALLPWKLKVDFCVWF